ncbi:MAG: NAD(P)-dependent alcohol dehydrogenase [Halioglobus sp.]
MAFRYQMTAPGAAQVKRVEADAVPPGPGEVQLRLRASSLNYHDYVTLSGLIPWVEYPRVPLSDGCGEVVAVGAGVSQFAPGDRVVTLFYPLWHSGRPTPQSKQLILGETTDGCLQEYLTIDARSVALAPAGLSDTQAATLTCAGHTAWYALMEEHRLQPGQTVLVQGSGGVSLFALQIARAVGARVIATSSSDEKLARMRAMGADHGVNYRTHPDWEAEVLKQAGGVDVAIDVGGEATLGKAIACANTDAFIAVIGVLGGFGAAAVSIFDVMQKNLCLRGVTVGCGESLARFCRFMEQHAIVPEVSHTLEAGQLREAVGLMERGEHFGKIGITVE